jgi:hypothetical protein
MFLFTDWLTAPAFTLARIAAAVGGAFLGYLLSGPLVRGMYRAAFHRPTPRLFAFWGKVLSGLLVGFLCYWFLPIGGDGGLGWGTGPGGGPGRGPGEGNKGAPFAKDDKDKVVEKEKEKKSQIDIRTKIHVLLLGPKHKVKDDKYYLVDKATTPEDLDALKKRLAGKENQVVVVIQLNDDSVYDEHHAVTKLVRELDKMKVARLGPAYVPAPPK